MSDSGKGRRCTGGCNRCAGACGPAYPVPLLQAVPLSVGLRLLEAPAADPLDARGGAARRGRQGLGRQPQRQRARPADADLPLLHAVGRGSERQLHGALFTRVPADRDQDDAGLVLQHGDDPHRGLRAAARDDRHARQRVLGLHPVQGDEGQARLHAEVRRRDATGTSCAPWRCSAPSPKACSCSPPSRC